MENLTSRVNNEFDVTTMESGDFFYFILDDATAAVLNVEGRVYFCYNGHRFNGDGTGRVYWGENRTDDMPTFEKSWVMDFHFDGTAGNLLERFEEKRRENGHDITCRLCSPSDTGAVASAPVVTDAEFVLKEYTTDNIYEGFHSYHHSHRDGFFNKPKEDKPNSHKIGVELEIEANSQAAKNKINKFRSNWFTQESDGSLGSYGIELITIPLLPKDAKARSTWESLCEALSPIAKSWDRNTCGLHVHIGREILGSNAEQKSETLGKLLFLYHHFIKDDPINIAIYGRSRAYLDKDGKTEEGNAVLLLGTSVLKDKSVKDKVDKAMKAKSNGDRYFDINIQNEKTVEFRKGKGSINVDRITSIIEYSEKMCLFAKQAKWEDVTGENFKKWMREKVAKTSPLYRYFTREENEIIRRSR